MWSKLAQLLCPAWPLPQASGSAGPSPVACTRGVSPQCNLFAIAAKKEMRGEANLPASGQRQLQCGSVPPSFISFLSALLCFDAHCLHSFSCSCGDDELKKG